MTKYKKLVESIITFERSKRNASDYSKLLWQMVISTRNGDGISGTSVEEAIQEALLWKQTEFEF